MGYNVNKEKFNQEIVDKNKKIWICEFCGHINHISIEVEEIPKLMDCVYLVKSANQIVQNNQDESSVILCIDTSGSMCQTTEIEGKFDFKNKVSKDEYEMLK